MFKLNLEKKLIHGNFFNFFYIILYYDNMSIIIIVIPLIQSMTFNYKNNLLLIYQSFF